MFLLPMYVAACSIAGREIPAARRQQMITYLGSVQNADGSVGLHAEGPGMMFTTVLCYVALRLLGLEPSERPVRAMHQWIRDGGTALGCANWGKFVLALLNLYDYQGLHPIVPELWLLPSAVPIHPSRLWCHCRQVYLPMAYLYGRRAAMPANELTVQLRTELYDEPYDQIRFRDHRDTSAVTDRYVPASLSLQVTQRVMDAYERIAIPTLRSRALTTLFDHIAYEDKVTHFIRIGPVNAVLNTLVHYFADPDGGDLVRSFETLDEYLWEGNSGVGMNGYNSTALWDTAFAVQAIVATPFAADYRQTLQRAYDYIRNNQVLADVPDRRRYYRHASRGGWPFSDRLHGWPITDCTAEGLKCALALEDIALKPIPEALLAASISLILSWQNPGGGWSTYERQRAGGWLEQLNPSGVFADIMVDYPYVECTSACVQALAQAQQVLNTSSRRRIERAIRRGERFIRNQQRSDGSWEGSWAVCFTYGTWFAVWGLLAAGCPANDRAIERACSFLQRQQNADGGWGEHPSSCTERRYVPSRQSHVVNTAWALLTLTRAGRANSEPAQRAAQYLMAHQLENGDWPRQTMVGVFNKTALIHYDNYRRYFPLWALASLASGRACSL